MSYLIEALSDQPIDQYTSTDASKFRDILFSWKLSSNFVKRVFSVIKALVKLNLVENGITTPNVFKNTYLPSPNDVRKRLPIRVEDIHRIQLECRASDDDFRWLVALISDTGMRLAEAVRLTVEDMKLESTYPHLVLQNHPWRSLKTTSVKDLYHWLVRHHGLHKGSYKPKEDLSPFQDTQTPNALMPIMSVPLQTNG